MAIKNTILPPHGGCGLINRFILEADRESFIQKALGFKVYTITNGDLATLYRIADGTLSPLDGPMDSADFYSLLEQEAIKRNAKKYAWTIPIIFPVSKKESSKFEIGETLVIRNEKGLIVGSLELKDIYYFDKVKYNKVIYGTDRVDYPGSRIANDDPRDYLLGGRVWVLPELKPLEYGKYLLSPEQTRALFKEKGWERIVAFQTRNPLHRSHEYAMVYAMEKLTKDGFFTGAVLNPLIGQTKNDDVPAAVRMKTYEVLVENKLLGCQDKDRSFWKTKDCDLIDNILLIALDIKMFYAGPKEAVMHAIYRQNLGCTDIIIGRKHADAAFDDGKPLWGDFDAQEKFNHLRGELLIRPFKVDSAAYLEELGRVGFAAEFRGRGYHEVTISGKDLRKKLENKEPIDERIMQRAVAEILYDAYAHNIGALRTDIKSSNIIWHDYGISKADREKRDGHKSVLIWLTGLPSSGKSTLATLLQALLFKAGCSVYILDGDNIRHGLNKDLGFSPEDRKENIRRIGEVAKLFTDAGMIVVAAFVSPYKQDRDAVRALFIKGDFIEVFVKSSLAVCEERDTKDLYKKARLGEIKEFTGISAPYEEPEHPELIINTDSQTPKESVDCVIRYLIEKGVVDEKDKQRNLCNSSGAYDVHTASRQGNEEYYREADVGTDD